MNLRQLKKDARITLIILMILGAVPTLAQHKPHSLEISTFNNTNIGLARTDHMNDYGVQARLSAQGYYEREPGSGFFYASDLALTKYDVYSNLDRTELSTQIGYVRKLGLGFDKPRISASLGMQYRNSASEIRSGWSIAPKLQYSRNISDRIAINANVSYYRFEAEDRIPIESDEPGWVSGSENPTSIQNTQLRLGGEWAMTPNSYLALDTTYIKGEFSSMALPSSGLSAYASAVSQDDVCGSTYYNYRYQGQGSVLALSFTHVFSDNLEAGFRFQRTLVDADEGNGYGQNITNFSLSKRF